MKKIITYSVISVLWLLAVILFCNLGKTTKDTDEHEFTILAVKEDAVKDYNNMPVFQKLNEISGHDVYYTYNTSMQYSNNPDPAGISGIDAIYHANLSKLKIYKYGQRKKIVAIDEYLNYMPNFKKILEERPDIKEALTSPDGHIYSLPRVEEMGLKEYPNILYIKKSLLETLIENNSPAVKGLTKNDLVDGLDLYRNEFKAILQEFNKMEGIIPLSFVSGNWQGNEADLFASFGLAENRDHKTIVNDKVIFTIEDPNWYRAICELNEWYSEGLIRSSAFTQDQDTFLAKGQNGSYGAFYWWEKKTVVADSDDYIIVKPLKDDDGNRYVGVSNELEIEAGECVILEACKDKAGLLSYFDNFFLPDYSAQLNYGSIESGAFETKKVNGKLIPINDHGEQSADDFRMRNAAYGVVYLTQNEWDNNVELEARAKLRVSDLANYVKPYTYANARAIPNLNYTEDELNSLQINETILTNSIKNFMTKGITDTKPTEADWRSFLSRNQAAIDAVKAINQAGYDRYLASLK